MAGAARATQADIFREVRYFYPPDTRFVVLPMDMTHIGQGPVREDIVAQHDVLAALARTHAAQVIPFATVCPDRPGAARQVRRWVARIADMIRSGDYPNFCTDISYTLFKFEQYMPLLRLYLEDGGLRRRVLFGSDFDMTRREHLSEKAVSIRLRDAIGPAFFRQIAEFNPADWLGEQAGAK